MTDLVFQEHTSQIQDFFSTSVQFQDSSGPEKSNLKFQYFSGPAATCTVVVPIVYGISGKYARILNFWKIYNPIPSWKMAVDIDVCVPS